jgi:methyl-accepting chemotaxis protein
MLLLIAIVFLGFGIIIALGVQLISDVKIGSARYVEIKKYQQALEKIEELKSDFNQIRVEYLTLAEESNPEIQKQGLATIYSINDKIIKKFREIQLSIPKEHQKPFEDARDEWQVFTDNMSGKIIPVILAGDKVLALERLQTIQKYRYERVASSLITVKGTLTKLARDLESSSDTYVHKRITTIIVACTLTALIILIIIIIITSLIVRPLHRAVRFAQDVSNGDLSKELNEPINDEVGALAASLNAMVSGLGSLFGKILSASMELSGVSQTISITSGQVSKETQIQSNNIARCSVAINEINQATQNILTDVTNLSISNHSTHSSVNEMVVNMSEVVSFSGRLSNVSCEVGTSISSINNSILTLDNSIDNLNDKTSETSSSLTLLEDSVLEIQKKADTTMHLAEQAFKYASSGQESVNATIGSMNEIRNSSKTTYDVITDLSSSVEDIGEILTAINEINDRISLLALNARIISAQAGDSGKAFGVVASEFNLLSKQTANSTLEIGQKIERVQTQTKLAVEAIKKTEVVVSHGKNLSSLSGEALGKIVLAVRQTSQEMDDISVSIENQRKGNGQITEAVNLVSETVQHIAKASHELKNESIHILSSFQQMNDMTGIVFSAMKENESAAKHVSRASENISQMIEQIQNNCETETVEIKRILDAMDEIGATLSNNLASAQTASEASNILMRQVNFLTSVVKQFKHNKSALQISEVRQAEYIVA